MSTGRMPQFSAARRRFLRLCGSGAVVFGSQPISMLRAAQATAGDPVECGNHIRSCILLIYYGGPSHLDTWDMKPNAPVEIRGEFRLIPTNVPGRHVCEHLPKTARVVDKLAIVRTMHHPMGNHNSAMFEALAGRTPTGGDQDTLGGDRKNDFPCYGSVLSYLSGQGLGPRSRIPLTHVALPHVMHNVVTLPGQNAGFLGAKYDPLQLTRDPNQPDFQVDQLRLPPDLPEDRLQRRRALLASLRGPSNETTAAVDDYRLRAFELLGSRSVRRALDISREPSAVRDRYGRHKLGQSLLLARRLVEAGVGFINVNDKIFNGQTANWDSHQNNFPRHRDDLLPPADQAFSALVEDLDQRGLLSSTLVVAMGEFGRTPKINQNAGRDHWPYCYSVVLAGAGVQGGAGYGRSDRIGAYPEDQPVTPGDLAATIFWRFGLDPRRHIIDRLDRPHRLALGNPLRELFTL